MIEDRASRHGATAGGARSPAARTQIAIPRQQLADLGMRRDHQSLTPCWQYRATIDLARLLQ